jgi:hypothetical protein
MRLSMERTLPLENVRRLREAEEFNKIFSRVNGEVAKKPTGHYKNPINKDEIFVIYPNLFFLVKSKGDHHFAQE